MEKQLYITKKQLFCVDQEILSAVNFSASSVGFACLLSAQKMGRSNESRDKVKPQFAYLDAIKNTPENMAV